MAWNTESTSVAHVKPQLRVLSKPLNVISVEHNTVRTTENARIVIALEHRLTPDVVVPRLTDSLLLRSKAVVLRLVSARLRAELLSSSLRWLDLLLVPAPLASDKHWRLTVPRVGVRTRTTHLSASLF